MALPLAEGLPRKSAVVFRARSPWLSDLRILLLGTWGFFRQCFKSFGFTRKLSRELDLDD